MSGSNAKIAYTGFGRVEMVAAADLATTLPFPPVFVADVANWNGAKASTPELDIEIKAAGATVLSDAHLYGVVQNQIEIATDDVDTVDFANNELDITAHGLVNGMGPLQLTTDGVLPTGLALATDYWVIYVGVGTISLALSLQDAIEGTAKVAFTDVGSGTHSILGSAAGDPEGDGSDFLTGTNNAFEILWLDYGLLGPANDGAITILGAVDGYTNRIKHRPRTVIYAVTATLSLAVNMVIALYPVAEAY